MGQVEDVSTCVTMDLKSAGNQVYLVGVTKNELGGSHLGVVRDLRGGQVPQVDTDLANSVFHKLHAAIKSGNVRSCHDLSEGGLAVAAAEMAFAGGLGVKLDIQNMQLEGEIAAGDADWVRLFAESNTRFLCEVTPENEQAFLAQLEKLPVTLLGQVTSDPQVVVDNGDQNLINQNIASLKEAWQAPLRW
jgi:phosphoribosylformylglycinamidine (FGAM) synthase-like enzyme